VNNNISVHNDEPWPLQPFDSRSPAQGIPGQRTYSAGSHVLDFPTLIRIVHQWRWLILSAVAAGLVVAIVVTLLTSPTYRAWVTIEANPPTVDVTTEQSRQHEATVQNTYDFVQTQVGLISSKTVAERTVQELNLAGNDDLLGSGGKTADRLKAATAMVQGGLNVIPPEEGTLIKFSYDASSPQLAALIANGVADSFINSTLQRRYEASAYARKFLERQIAKTRSDLEQSERDLVAYAQKQGIISTATGEDGRPATSDAASLQGESLVTLNRALADATARRVAAEGAYRQALASGPTAEVTTSTLPLRQQLATLQAEYQQKRTFLKPDHPDMRSLQAQMDELNKQIANAAGQMSSSRANGLRADYRAALSAEQALRARVNQLKGAVLNLRGRSIQ
jgi:uncharacterized protein involved in exopolysaccharide biosynthesis